MMTELITKGKESGPKVSVIITTYNRASILTETINSVLEQTFKNFELIVVDDGSTDNTRQALEKYGSRIYYAYQENKGRAMARNTGIGMARGAYLAFFDDDDLWLPDKLEKQVAFLDANPGIGLVHTFTYMVDKNGCILPLRTKEQLKLYRKALKMGYTYERLSHLCIIFLSTIMVRKECLDEIGLFDPNTSALEDWDFELRFSLKYSIGTIPEPLAKVRIHEEHTGSDEFTRGRINTSLKHLNLLDSLGNYRLREELRCNFLAHLSTAYYIAADFAQCRRYGFEALQLNPFVLFRYLLGIHLLITLLPFSIIPMLRRLRQSALKL